MGGFAREEFALDGNEEGALAVNTGDDGVHCPVAKHIARGDVGGEKISTISMRKRWAMVVFIFMARSLFLLSWAMSAWAMSAK